MTTWQAIRRIKWDDTYDALVLLIKKGINTRKSIKAKKRLERWTTVFEIDKGHLVYRTTTPQPDQIDSKDGKPLLEAYKRPKTYRVVPPAQKEDVILKLYHSSADGGFRGVVSLWRKLQAQTIGIIRPDVASVLKRLELKQLQAPVRDRVLTAIIHKHPMERIQSDVVSLEQFSYWNSEFKYLCVVVDHFSKFALAVIPLKNMEGEPLANLIQNEVYLKYGPPESHHTDNGTEIINKHFRELLERYGKNIYVPPLTNRNPSVRVSDSTTRLGK